MRLIRTLNNYFLAAEGEEITVSDYVYFYGSYIAAITITIGIGVYSL